MYLHKSLNNNKFLANRKLQLFKSGIINISQFVSLIQISDPFTVIGPAIVDKEKIQQFMFEWKEQNKMQLNEDGTITQTNTIPITQQDIIDKIPDFIRIFPQVKGICDEFMKKITSLNNCPTCQKNKYILLILGTIRQLYNDGRDLYDLKDFIENLLFKYYPLSNKVIAYNNIDQFDVDWIKPDIMVALGNDLIQGLSACFDCAKKHISRAKAFYEEWRQGYPEHSSLMYSQFTQTNQLLEKAYTLFWDSLGQLDMASSELIGNIIEIDTNFKIEIIELANKIRKARILFQEDSEQVPNWDKLRLEIQILQNKVNQVGEKMA